MPIVLQLLDAFSLHKHYKAGRKHFVVTIGHVHAACSGERYAAVLALSLLHSVVVRTSVQCSSMPVCEVWVLVCVEQFKQAVRSACRETFDGDDPLFSSAAGEEELQQLFRAVDSDIDGFIGTKEFKNFLVGCTSVFLRDTDPDTGDTDALGGEKTALSPDDEPGQNISALKHHQGMPSTVLLRRKRRVHNVVSSSATVGWLAPTAASQAMSNQSCIQHSR